MRKYKLNENYFDVIDTYNKAYFLGFIVADGCVYKNNYENRLVLSISSKDDEILKALLSDMDSDYKILYLDGGGYENSSPISRVSINSKKIVDSLIKLGVTQRKTGKESIPNIEKKYMPHFIRGFFDGDGGIFYSRGYPTISFTSGEQFLNQLNCFLSNEIEIDIKNIYKESKNKKAHRLYYSKQDEVVKLIDYMYNNTELYLHRKYKICMKHYNDIISKRQTTNANIDKNNELRKLLKQYLQDAGITQTCFANEIGSYPVFINDFLKGKKKTLKDDMFNKIQAKIASKKEGYDNDIIKSLK